MGRFPAHADAEIKAAKGARKKELQAFWESWAAIGDAKDALTKHLEKIAKLAVALSKLPDGREADDVLARIRKLESETAVAGAAVDAAIEVHKAGG